MGETTPRISKRWAALAVVLLFLASLPALAEWPHPGTHILSSDKSFANW